MLNRIFSILSSQWLIHEDTALSYLPILISFIKGQEILLKADENKKPYIVAWSVADQSVNTVSNSWEIADTEIPENSVAVIPLSGVICSWDSLWLMTLLQRVKANDRINAVILVTNSPGGMVQGTDILASAIKDLGKPVVALIMGMACSAAMWAISGASYRIASSPIDSIGSIGTKTSIQDYTVLLEKNGIKIMDIYATLSTRKDEEVRALLATPSNPKPMQDYIDFVNEVFHQAIRDNMGIAANSEVFTGAAFFAQKAKDLGLIDEINTMDYALNYAYKLGLKNKINSQFKQLKFN